MKTLLKSAIYIAIISFLPVTLFAAAPIVPSRVQTVPPQKLPADKLLEQQRQMAAPVNLQQRQNQLNQIQRAPVITAPVHNVQPDNIRNDIDRARANLPSDLRR